MQIRNDGSRFGAVSQALHWAVVALMVAIFWVAISMDGLPLGPELFRLVNLHKSLGLTILVIMLIRLVWRHVSPPPPLPEAMPGWERRAAHLSHGLFYVLLIAQPLIGVLHSWSSNFPVVVYGLFTLPNPLGPHKAWVEPLEGLHGFLGWSLAALVGLHVAAALKHHFVTRDDVLLRMLPGGGSR